MGKLEVNKRHKESSLLNTAFEFFTTKGFSKTSISDIVGHAGVAKGTFYLYFKDKYDIRNKLICHKSSQLFRTAVQELRATDAYGTMPFEDRILYIIDNIVTQLAENQALLTFIAKNLSWGVFRNSLIDGSSSPGSVRKAYEEFIARSPVQYKDPDILLYMILEFISGASYNAILYDQPCPLAELKPHMYDGIRAILRSAEVK